MWKHEETRDFGFFPWPKSFYKDGVGWLRIGFWWKFYYENCCIILIKDYQGNQLSNLNNYFNSLLLNVIYKLVLIQEIDIDNLLFLTA